MRLLVDGTEFFCQRHGRGVPILVIHGGPGLDHSYFRPWLDGLGNEAELIYLDLRGNGRSGGRNTINEITIESWAADVDKLRQTLGLGRCVVLGHSFGAFVALEYARTFSEHLLGLALCSATPALDYPAQAMSNAQALATGPQLQAIMHCLSQPVKDDLTFRKLWMQTLPVYFHRYEPAIGAGMDDTTAYSAAAYNRGTFDLLPNFNAVPWLGDISAPTLILVGRHDWLMPMEHGAERLKRGIRRAAVQVFEQSGHFPFIEETVGFCQTLREWLRKL